MSRKSMHRQRLLTGIAGAAALALAVSAAPAAAAGYLKLGDIKGESTQSSDKPRIAVLEVESWSWGETRAKKGGNVEYSWKVEEAEGAAGPDAAPDMASRDAASGLPSGKRQHKPLAVTKPVDKASPKLAEAVAKGKVFPSEPRPGRGTLAVMVPAGTCVAGTRHADAQLDTGDRVYTMADVVVTSCSPAPSSGNERPMESLSLNYTKITW